MSNVPSASALAPLRRVLAVSSLVALAVGLAAASSACGGTSTSEGGGDAGASGDGSSEACAIGGGACPAGTTWSATACACVGTDGGADAGSDAATGDNPCVSAGGSCAAIKPENMTCPQGSYQADLPALGCPNSTNGSPQACCVTRDGNGHLPPATDGACACGSLLLCPAGSTCNVGTDTVRCAQGDAGSACTPP